MKSLNSWVFAIFPVFMLARCPSTKHAMDSCLLSELNGLYWRFLYISL
jgi:hypothetical protein